MRCELGGYSSEYPTKNASANRFDDEIIVISVLNPALFNWLRDYLNATKHDKVKLSP
jgi:hypothetical protein